MHGSQENERSPVRQLVRRAAVLGAGTMGAQIAAMLANEGIPCDLLDLAATSGGKTRLAEEAKARLLSMKPSPVSSPEALALIRPGNFADDLPRLHDADWVIEAIVEKLYAKRRLWTNVAPYLGRHVIASTNTSAIPIADIAQALPPSLRARFLGTHFFNPPRLMKLLEVIPTPETDHEVAHDVRRFAERVLGKEVVAAHDVPGFITNRIGCYLFLVTLRAMDEFGLGPDEVDSITGPAMGRPNSATFRTLDLVGIDIFVDICDNIRGSVTDRAELAAFDVPAYLRAMINRDWKGQKSGQGFYKRVQDDEGRSQILTLDLATMDYAARQQTPSPSLSAVRSIEDAAERLRALVWADYPAAHFAWRVLSRLMAYAAWKVGEVADDTASIDKAMRLGFGWTFGPFETWDALGVPETFRRMKDDGLDLPVWVVEIANHGQRFYSREARAAV